MRILIVSQYYYPESFRINDVGNELVKRGHLVDALVGIPNYPTGKFFDGYGLFKKRKEKLNGVGVFRVFQIPRGTKSSKILLSLNYLTYVFSSCFWILFKYSFKKKYDATFVFQTSPVTQAIPAVLLKKIRKTPVYLWVQDVWPDSVVVTLSNQNTWYIKKMISALSRITEYVYSNSYRIMYSSSGMKDLINRKHDYSEKMLYVPNWCDDLLSMPRVEAPKVPNGFTIMMAGNIGFGMGVDGVVELVKSLSDIKNLNFMFVGGGSLEQYMRDKVAENKLTNVIMTGRMPFEQMPELYRQADCMFISLLKTDVPHLMATVPSRLQSYMAAGKPVIGMIDGCAPKVIMAADCGFCAEAGDYKTLGNYIRNVILTNPDDFKRKGGNARAYYEKYYMLNGCMDNIEYYLNSSNNGITPYAVPEV